MWGYPPIRNRDTFTYTAVAILAVAACTSEQHSATTEPPSATTTPSTEPPPTTIGIGCDPSLPRAACAQLRRVVHPLPALHWDDEERDEQLAACREGTSAHRVGRWHYAVAASLHTLARGVSSAQLRRAWTGRKTGLQLAMTNETARMFERRWGRRGPRIQISARPEPSATRWVVVPADELTPRWKTLAVDGVFPLGKAAATSPLSFDLCLHLSPTAQDALGPRRLAITNLDPARATLLVMTGVTAPTRNTGLLMDAKGPRYPARDIAHWFGDADFVHVSNEVSFHPRCKVEPRGIVLCAKERYIELLEAIKANIIELTGSHLSDWGRPSIPHTLDMYRERKWRWYGGGADQLEATRPLLVTHHDNRLAFLGCNVERSEHHLVRNGPGVAHCDYARMRRQVRDLRRRGYLPIVTIQHWERYSHAPPKRLVTELRSFAENGAAVVLGSQAHQAKPWEVHHGAFVHYGPGNLFFDQMRPGTREGVVDRLHVYAGRLLAVEQRFTMLEEYGRPRPMKRWERRRLLRTLFAEVKKLRPRARPGARPAIPARESRQRPDSLLVDHGRHTLEFLAYVPARVERAPASRRWPLIVFLHGTDKWGDDLNLVRTRGLPKRIERLDDFPFIVVSPQLGANQVWSPSHVMQLIELVLHKYPVDPDRVYLTGLSLGGFGVWKTAARYPKLFAALVMIAGGGDVGLACAVKDLPLWALHNRGDENVDADLSRDVIAAMKRCGAKEARLTIYPVDGHNAWDRTFADPALYRWLLSHRRPQ